jgi:voltage-gated potassium channel Kch
MTLTLTLTPEKESRLAAQARAAGLTLDDYAQHLLDLAAGEDPTPDPAPQRTLAEMLQGRIGTVASGQGDLSQNTGKRFTEMMVEKHRKGRL